MGFYQLYLQEVRRIDPKRCPYTYGQNCAEEFNNTCLIPRTALQLTKSWSRLRRKMNFPICKERKKIVMVSSPWNGRIHVRCFWEKFLTVKIMIFKLLTWILCKDFRKGLSEHIRLNCIVLSILKWSISSQILRIWFQGILRYGLPYLCNENCISVINMV